VVALLALRATVGPSDAGTLFEERLGVCAGCHGADGNSTTEGIPSLAGQPEIFLVTQLILFREGLRASVQMASQVAGLDDMTIEAIAEHFAALPPLSTDGPEDPALMVRGRELARTGRCGQCHLPDFCGRAQIPRLAGQRQDYLRTVLTAYRDGTRGGADTTMNDVMHGVSDADIRGLAHFLARQAPRARGR
jgi:cytochrome c553